MKTWLALERTSDLQQGTIVCLQFDDDRIAQTRMGVAVEQHDPAVVLAPLSGAGAGDVDDLVIAEALPVPLPHDLERAPPRIEREHPPPGARRILQRIERHEQHGTKRNPEDVDGQEAAGAGKHGGYDTGP